MRKMPVNPENAQPAQIAARVLAMVGAARIQAAANGEDGKPAARRFELDAYNGGAMRFYWTEYPVVVDLAGMEISDKPRPVLKDHDTAQVVGHSDRIWVEAGKLRLTGVASGTGPAAVEVLANAENGFPWQASIGADMLETELIRAGESTRVNGQTFAGPVLIVRASRLSEVSFVALGADDSTAARMIAKRDETHTKEPKTMTDELKAAREAAAADTLRIADIRKVAADHPAICAQAITEGWTAEKAELTVLRAARAAAPAPTRGADVAVSGQVLEAAMLMAARAKPEALKGFDDKQLEAASRMQRNGFSLGQFLIEAARAKGYTGRGVKVDREIMRAAFSLQANGVSQIDTAGILGNVANKSILASFMGVEAAWAEIAAIGSVSDFKTVTRYRLNGDMSYEKVGPGGELKHGKLSEESFTAKVDTYGLMLALTRNDIINDDLGALASAGARLGRGAALKINDVFWAEFLADHGTFYPAAGLISGASSALSLAGLALAEQKFLERKDADNKPLAVRPELLIVPPALSAKARELMASTEIRDTTASTKAGTTNIFAGRFRPIVSSYLTEATEWYLNANPADLPAIELSFLNGQQSPTIETSEADFNTLGIQMRGFHDFGAKKQDKRASVKSEGA